MKEWQGEVVFLHEVVAGAADRSYGIQVAKLAGLPASVIERAKLVLAKLEQEDRAAPKGFEDLPLFAAAGAAGAGPAARPREDPAGRGPCRAQPGRPVAARGDGRALPPEARGGEEGLAPAKPASLGLRGVSLTP